jgi:hypothetical protein
LNFLGCCELSINGGGCIKLQYAGDEIYRFERREENDRVA